MKMNSLSVLLNISIRIIFICGMLHIVNVTDFDSWRHWVALIIGYGYLGSIVSSAYLAKVKEEFYLAMLRDINNRLNAIKAVIKEAKEKK